MQGDSSQGKLCSNKQRTRCLGPGSGTAIECVTRDPRRSTL